MVASISALMVWKSKNRMDSLGSLLFPTQTHNHGMTHRSESKCLARPPVPGSDIIAANLLAKAWNEAPDLRSASTLGAAKSAARKWAKSLDFKA